jgi:hypothetical protein
LNNYIFLAVFLGLFYSAVLGQNSNKQWQVGYFTPYFSDRGVTVGYAFDLKELRDDSAEQRKSNHRLQILAQLGYYSQANLSNNILLNPELVYRWNKIDKRFFLTSSVGTGYLFTLQRQEGSLNLATGETDYRNDALNYFLPTLNMGLGVDPKKNVGFYFKTTYGKKFSKQNANKGIFAISTGLILKFNSKNKQ